MGILEKTDMLYLLAAIFALFLLLNLSSARAGFFEKEAAPVQENGCSECKSDPINFNPDLKEKVAAIESSFSNNLNKRENTYGNEIILYIDLSDSFSDVAVNALAKFKKDNPDWKVRGVIVRNQKDLKEKLLQKQMYFSNGIEFSIDLSGSLVKEFSIFRTPAYVITYNCKHHKITGLVDLNDAISKLDK